MERLGASTGNRPDEVIIISPGSSRASSRSSSLSSSSSFNPHDPAPVSPSSEGRRPSALGLREIRQLYKADRKGKAPEEAPDIPITLQEQPGPSTSRTGMERGFAGTETGVFAADVSVRGWKIVGGSKWTGDAKVGAYVVYDIEITKRAGGQIEILRRYTDFVRLRNGLKAKFPHLKASIPTLPGKNHMSKFSEKLLHDRKPRLQRFLRTVMLHPEMGRGGVGSLIGEWILSGTTTTATKESL